MNAITELHPVLIRLSSAWMPQAANAQPALDARAGTSGLDWAADLFADDVWEEPDLTPAPRTDWASVWAGDRLEAACAKVGYRMPDLFEPAHILFRADPADPASMAAALARAEQALSILRRSPKRFDELARAVSECPSSANGGRLGSVLLADVTTEFARVMRTLEPGQLGSMIVHTSYGVHIIRLDDRIRGRTLPVNPAQDHAAPLWAEHAA